MNRLLWPLAAFDEDADAVRFDDVPDDRASGSRRSERVASGLIPIRLEATASPGRPEHREDDLLERRVEKCLRLAEIDYLDLDSLALPHKPAPKLTFEKRIPERSAVPADEYSLYVVSPSELQKAIRGVRSREPHHLRARARVQREVMIFSLAFDVALPRTLDADGEQCSVKLSGRKHSLFQ
jgi:hypothetical protein